MDKAPTLVRRAVHAVRDADILTRPLACGGLQISPALCADEAELERLAEGIRKALATLP
ncbi:hypothetical protein [Streptomyces sp. NPDC091215]|uniref:hypothetical protein n=1 Tax=Streptomyces sp. NPDC091215 TaxID=3155192 RepID=UPI00342D897E